MIVSDTHGRTNRETLLKLSNVMKLTTEIIAFIIASSNESVCEWRQTTVKDANRTLYNGFYPCSRYKVDYAEDFFTEGWEQYDTDQDASYFGCWFNKTKMLTLCYAEGDWMLVVCKNAEGFNAELKEMGEFYGTTPEFITIGEGLQTNYYQDRSAFTL